MDAPSFRIWPPLALGVPLVVGLLVSAGPGDPVQVGTPTTRWFGWTLVLVPVGVAVLWWGAVRPEERYLASKFGAEYDAYRARVRRWL